jgi:hypothetical protein
VTLDGLAVTSTAFDTVTGVKYPNTSATWFTAPPGLLKALN